MKSQTDEGTITMPFDMTVLDDLDRFHLLLDTIDRLPQPGATREAARVKVHNAADRKRIRNRASLDRIESVPADA